MFSSRSCPIQNGRGRKIESSTRMDAKYQNCHAESPRNSPDELNDFYCCRKHEFSSKEFPKFQHLSPIEEARARTAFRSSPNLPSLPIAPMISLQKRLTNQTQTSTAIRSQRAGEARHLAVL